MKRCMILLGNGINVYDIPYLVLYIFIYNISTKSLLKNILTGVPQVSLHARKDIMINDSSTKTYLNNDSSTKTYLKTALKKEMYLNLMKLKPIVL